VLVGSPLLPGASDPEPALVLATPVHDISGASPRRLLGKRMFDVVLALVLIVITLPIMIAVALAIFVSARGPILFHQLRVGRSGRPFRILKFRTMATSAELILYADCELHWKYVNFNYKLPTTLDHRLIRIGRWLRLTSLDELPQLFNVLGGSMSLVGPRPVTSPELTHYGTHLAAFLSVKPGITGPWQVGGRNDVGYPERARIDVQYANTWTVHSDVLILLKTVGAVIRQKGAI
jgi:lipopolysaccharide/colanic/teichoic acid biosynthesis glycosyltransferase